MMKMIRSTLAAAAVLFTGVGAANAAEVKVTLTGVQPRGGVLYAALQTREQFMQKRGTYGAHLAKPPAGVAQLTIEGVAPGEYALVALHDANEDRDMNFAPNGMPVEGAAMSNSAALRGPPTFDQVKVTIGADATAISTAMYYLDGKVPTDGLR